MPKDTKKLIKAKTYIKLRDKTIVNLEGQIRNLNSLTNEDKHGTNTKLIQKLEENLQKARNKKEALEEEYPQFKKLKKELQKLEKKY